MKSRIFILAIFCLFSYSAAYSQTPVFKPNGWQLNGGIGVDRIEKKYDNGYFNPQLDGFYGQLAAMKFWKLIGVEVNARYYKNDNLGLNSAIKNKLNLLNYNDLTQNNSYIQRLSITGGPSIKIPLFNNKVEWRLGVLGGYTYIHGSRLIVQNNQQTLLEDAGFPSDNYEPLGMATSSILVNIGNRWSVGLQGHYNKLFTPKSVVNYLDLNQKTANTKKYDFTSYGAGISIIYKFGKTPPPPPVQAIAKPPLTKDIIVEVTDLETGEKLKNARVKIIESKGFIHRAVTDSNGVAIFPTMLADNYRIEAELNKVNTKVQEIAPKDFEIEGSSLRVGLEHSDPRFTLIGNTIEKQTKENVGGVYVILKNTRTGEENQVLSDSKTGEFNFQLERESNYSVFGRKDSFISEIETVTTEGLKRSQNLYVKLKIALEETVVGKVIDLKNIYYNYDKADLDEVASRDLQKLLQFMNDNPNIKIELNSHTDSRGTSAYNMQLSQKRAENVLKFLITKGITSNRLIAYGNGESKLKNGCNDNTPCTEEEHAINRRTEFMVIK